MTEDEDEAFERLSNLFDASWMPKHYDRQGNEISWKDAARLRFGDDGTYKIVAKTQVGEIEVSTVWLGMDHNWTGGAPLIFETMCFGQGAEDLPERVWRYPTEEAALAGHDQVVMLVRENCCGEN